MRSPRVPYLLSIEADETVRRLQDRAHEPAGEGRPVPAIITGAGRPAIPEVRPLIEAHYFGPPHLLKSDGRTVPLVV